MTTEAQPDGGASASSAASSAASSEASSQASSEGSFDAVLGALARAPDVPVEAAGRGSRVGRYTLLEQLGRGGMGAVYRARDDVLDRQVALKLILAADSPVDRFRREVMALARVSHENVVTVHDAGVDAGRPFVVLELVEGDTLRARLRNGALGVEATERLARELARGLGAAHAVGVVHRDLKPENVLLDARGAAKLVDFGLARILDRGPGVPDPGVPDPGVPDLGRTEAGTVLGTAPYMAPEQIRGEPGDARTDLFALGAVLYEALTGRRAFDGPTRADVISAVLRDQPATDPTLLPDPRARRLLGVAFRCLEKDRARRFASAAALLEALDDDPAAPVGPASRALPLSPAGPPEDLPETRYARSSGVHIAYQVVSPPGLPTLLAAAPFISNVDVVWEAPEARAWLRAHADFTHFIHYDRRGVGMSDPIAPECTLDERVEDLRAVLDAEGVSRAFLLGVSEGGPVAIAFAVRYPERTLGLVLQDTFARLCAGDGYPHGRTRAEYEDLIDRWVARWGTPKTLSTRLFTASRAEDPAFLRWANRYERQCASPGTVRRLLDLQFAIDVRALVPRVACPALVLHRSGDPAILVEHGRWLGAHLPNARYVELDGVDHAPWLGDTARPLALTRELVRSR